MPRRSPARHRATLTPTRRVLALAAVLVVAALVAAPALIGMPTRAGAAGSAELYPSLSAASSCTAGASGACRANIEWRTNSYGPAGSSILRRTVFDVYARAGEILEAGSSAVGVGSGDVLVWNPGAFGDDRAPGLPALTTGDGGNGFRCSAQRAASGVAAQGRITSRALELAGPRSADGTANPGGYVPCTFTAPATGIYKVVFLGPAGAGSAADGSPTGERDLSSARNFDASQGTSVSAFDVSVRPDAASATTITGRVFTYALAAFTGGNGRPVDLGLYVTSLTGYRYRLDTNGLDPNGFLIYGNEQGFLDPEGDPLNHDVLGSDGQLSSLAGGVSLAPPEYPLSFYPLADATLAALGIPTTPVVPDLGSLSFTGSAGGSDARLGRGGVFDVFANTHGTAAIVISRDGKDFDAGNPVNRVLREVVDAGSHEIAWDGLDNAGDPFPAGRGYAVRASLRTGYVHFPLLDAENSLEGGPAVTLLNPPKGLCPYGNSACTTAFYDDRGYHTDAGGADGTDVGTPGAVLCGQNAPAVAAADPVSGYVSTSTQRRYGSASGGNTNVSCTGSFGDAKGLDTWTSYPGTGQQTQLNVLAASSAPEAADDAYTAGRDTTLTVPAARGVLANDSGTQLTASVVTPPDASTGTLSLAPDGSLSFTPAAGFTGMTSFTYDATDVDGNAARATATITVVPPVVARDDSGTTRAGTALVVPTASGVLANDTAPAGTAIDGVTTPAHGTVSIRPDGSYTYTPAAGFAGTDSFRYSLTGPDGSTSSATVALTVVAPPVARDDSAHIGQGGTLTVPASAGLLANDTATDGSAALVSGPAHGSATVGADGSYVYTPDASYSGTDAFTYRVTDRAGGTATAVDTVTVDPAPVARDDEGRTYADTVLDVSPASGLLADDDGTGLTVTAHDALDPAAGMLEVRPDGSYTYTPASSFAGDTSVGYTVTDRDGATATATLTLHVSAVPRAVDDEAVTTAGATLSVPGADGVLLNDAVPDGTTVAVGTRPAHGMVDLDAAGGGFVYTPDAGYGDAGGGADSFTYTATTPDGRTASATVRITIDPRPVANDDTGATSEGVPLVVGAGDGLLANDTGTGIRVATSSQPAHGSVTVNADGSYSYTPAPGYSGVDTFAYSIVDANGQTSTSVATVTVTVSAGPTAVRDTGQTFVDTTLTVDAASGLLANDSGAGIRVTAHTDPSSGTLTLDADGSYAYVPDAGFTGTDTFTYTITDSRGSVATAPVRLTVAAEPRAADDSYSTPEGTALTVPASDGLLLDDNVPDGTEVTQVGQPAHGTVVLDGTGGGFTYTPADGYTGPDSFRYTFTTPSGAQRTGRAYIAVSPPPHADDDAYTAPTGGVLSVPASRGLLTGDTGDGISVTSETDPSSGTVTVRPDGSFDYRATGADPTATFRYTITDRHGQTSSGTVTIRVAAPPVARDDSGTTAEDTPLSVAPAAGLLANDAGTGLTVTRLGQPEHGRVDVTSDGGWTFTPEPGFTGTTAFPYTVTDAAGQTAQAVAVVTVTPAAAGAPTPTPTATPAPAPGPTSTPGPGPSAAPGAGPPSGDASTGSDTSSRSAARGTARALATTGLAVSIPLLAGAVVAIGVGLALTRRRRGGVRRSR